MRLWLYKDVYFPNATQKDEDFMKHHLGKVYQSVLRNLC
jgi:hypothetical protein